MIITMHLEKGATSMRVRQKKAWHPSINPSKKWWERTIQPRNLWSLNSPESSWYLHLPNKNWQQKFEYLQSGVSQMSVAEVPHQIVPCEGAPTDLVISYTQYQFRLIFLHLISWFWGRLYRTSPNTKVAAPITKGVLKFVPSGRNGRGSDRT
jgi:hypothetical protein